MKKIGITTLGCRVNQYESDAIAELFSKKGYKVVPLEKDCDLYLINTCTVTAESDSKCRQTIRRALRYREETSSPVAVIGCFPQGVRGRCEELERADFVSGNTNKAEIVHLLEEVLSGKRFNLVKGLSGAEYEELKITSCRYVKAYVKIEDGCNNFCSYCYVPYVRGRVRSRNEDDIIAEISRLKGEGYREIILSGIETSAYGEDRGEKDAFCRLVERIQKETPVERLRFGSLNPAFFTRERLDRLSQNEGVMPHFHLSVQSASTDVLSLMRRGYDEEKLYRVAEDIRARFENANLSADMICGFPGEREEDFQKSVDFIKNAKILHTHIFPYSKREGTLASTFDFEVEKGEIHRRARAMQKVADEVHDTVFSENVGKEYRVLLEFFKNGRTLGYTENFLNVSLPTVPEHKKGDIIPVKIEHNINRKIKN